MSCSKRPSLGRIRCGENLRIEAADVIRQEHGMIEEDLGLPARLSECSARCRREDDARRSWCGSVRDPRPAGVEIGRVEEGRHDEKEGSECLRTGVRPGMKERA